MWRIRNVLMRIRILLFMRMRIQIFFIQNLKKIFTGNFLSKNYLIDEKNADISFDYGEGLKTWD